MLRLLYAAARSDDSFCSCLQLDPLTCSGLRGGEANAAALGFIISNRSARSHFQSGPSRTSCCLASHTALSLCFCLARGITTT